MSITSRLDEFVDRAGAAAWSERLADIRRGCGPTHAGRALLRRYLVELAIERMRRPGRNTEWTAAEGRIAALVGAVVELADTLTEAGRARLDQVIASAVSGGETLVPLLHLMRVAGLQRDRGFEVGFEGFEGAPFDLLLRRDNEEAELAAETVSAEDGRAVTRGAWFQLVDRIDPDLQSWLASHPGRYLLKVTLPQGLREGDAPAGATLPELHRRITRLLSESRRADYDEAAVLRLDPLMLAAAQADELGLMPSLRREFGPEAHLAVTSAGQGVFVMAARAGREDEVAAAVRRRMAAIAPARLTGTRPGILAMFVEDTDALEWARLRDQLLLEREARQFLTTPSGKSVVAVSCASRMELYGEAAGNELRFRNPSHPGAGSLALSPAVVSTKL